MKLVDYIGKSLLTSIAATPTLFACVLYDSFYIEPLTQNESIYLQFVSDCRQLVVNMLFKTLILQLKLIICVGNIFVLYKTTESFMTYKTKRMLFHNRSSIWEPNYPSPPPNLPLLVVHKQQKAGWRTGSKAAGSLE